MTTARRFPSLLALLLAIGGCWDIPGPDIELPIHVSGSGGSPDPHAEPCDDGGDEGEPEPCEGSDVPGMTADDPCCVVHQCLVGSGPSACSNYDVCTSLAPDDAVCGDLLCAWGDDPASCNDICVEANICLITDECLDSCDDPCDMDCLLGCWLPSPDCLGNACVAEYACEECP